MAQAESVVIRNSQAVPGRCSRVAVAAVGNYGQFSAARVRGRLGGRQHLSEYTQKSDECCAAALGIKSVVSELDIFISSAGNLNIMTSVRTKKLKRTAFVGNTSHFENESTWLLRKSWRAGKSTTVSSAPKSRRDRAGFTVC